MFDYVLTVFIQYLLFGLIIKTIIIYFSPLDEVIYVFCSRPLQLSEAGQRREWLALSPFTSVHSSHAWFTLSYACVPCWMGQRPQCRPFLFTKNRSHSFFYKSYKSGRSASLMTGKRLSGSPSLVNAMNKRTLMSCLLQDGRQVGAV